MLSGAVERGLYESDGTVVADDPACGCTASGSRRRRHPDTGHGRATVGFTPAWAGAPGLLGWMGTGYRPRALNRL